MENAQDTAARNQMLWFAGAVGTAVGIAVWAYSRKEPTYWEKTRRVAGQLAESAAEINPWVGAGAGTAALGGAAALAYRRKRTKTVFEDVRPSVAKIATAAIGVASALASAKTRNRAATAISEGTSTAADHVADVGNRIWQRLQLISEEGAKLYPHLRKMIA
jgi:hypothetical protein